MPARDDDAIVSSLEAIDRLSFLVCVVRKAILPSLFLYRQVC